MKYCNITYPDINNGLGCRVTLWVSGCPHHCPGCHNSMSWDKSVGKIYNEIETFDQIKTYLDKEYIKGLTLSGGESLDLTDREKLITILGIVKKVREIYGNTKDIWAYSGYTLAELKEDSLASEILKEIDVLVDGRFILEQRNVSLPFRGSENQRIYKKNKNGGFELYTDLI